MSPVDPSNLRRVFGRISEKAGLGHWHPHELRHSNASLLSAAGVALETVADVLGHSSARITSAVYRHRVAESIDAAVLPLETLFGAKE